HIVRGTHLRGFNLYEAVVAIYVDVRVGVCDAVVSKQAVDNDVVVVAYSDKRPGIRRAAVRTARAERANLKVIKRDFVTRIEGDRTAFVRAEVKEVSRTFGCAT